MDTLTAAPTTAALPSIYAHDEKPDPTNVYE